jgi:pimeloyl-ACP methyl ester carboxylesterase
VREFDLDLGDGRTLHAYDAGGDRDALPLLWHHGTPNVGTPPAERLGRAGVRWFAFDRPGYRSTRLVARDVASAAGYAVRVADALGIDRFAVMGHSGGGSHALACAALLPDRVTAVATISGLAPYGAEGLEFFAGMAEGSEESLRAASRGRAEKERFEGTEGVDIGFTPGDFAALDGDWAWFLDVVRPAVALGPDGAVDDDLAHTQPWGFDPASVAVPVLVLHGEADRMVPAAHGRWLAGRIPRAELRVTPGDGHITVMRHAADALEWLRKVGS